MREPSLLKCTADTGSLCAGSVFRHLPVLRNIIIKIYIDYNTFTKKNSPYVPDANALVEAPRDDEV